MQFNVEENIRPDRLPGKYLLKKVLYFEINLRMKNDYPVVPNSKSSYSTQYENIIIITGFNNEVGNSSMIKLLGSI